MALERVGLGATITANEKPFVQATDKSRDALGRFIKTSERASPAVTRMGRSMDSATRKMLAGSKRIAGSVRKLSQGVRDAALGMVPLTIAVGAGAIKAAKFEQQMSAVGAITRADEQDMASLTKEAKRMGIVSVFSATQAGEGMEYLARAGAKPHEIIAALQGTMNAAAADSIGLAEASNIVAQVVKGMGLEWGQAAHVADVLALTSAKANTDILGLGESFKYGVSQAKALGISLEETSAIFGKLSDAGLKGSLAGTAFTNMMNKLAKPSSKAKGIMKKWNIELNNSDGSLRKVSSIVDDVSKRMVGIKNASEKAYIASELFGIRGARAFNALKVAGKDALDTLEDQLVASSAGIGAATEMAEKRLDNFLGKMTLFGASVESVSIGLFGPLLKTFTPTVEKLTNGLNNVLFSLEGLSEMRNKENQENSESARLIAKEATARLKAAGASQKQVAISNGALQVLSRMKMSEEQLSSTQVAARKRALQAAIDAANKTKAEEIKSRALKAAGVKEESQLGKARAKMLAKQLAAFSKAKQTEATQQIDAAFRGGEGAKAAQYALQRQILQNALDTNKNMSAAQRKRVQSEIMNLIELESAQSKHDDSIRAQIFSVEKLEEIEKKHGKTAVLIAKGIQAATDQLSQMWKNMVARVKSLGESLRKELGDDKITQITKWVTIISLIAAAVVPVIMGFTVFGFAISGLGAAFSALLTIASGVLTIIGGLLTALAGAALPIILVVGALGLAFAMLRNEGETVRETLTRVMLNIKMAVMDLWQNAIMPFISGFVSEWNMASGIISTTFGETWLSITQTFTEVVAFFKEQFGGIVDHFTAGTGDMSINWVEFGKTTADIILWVITGAITAIGWLVKGAMKWMTIFWEILSAPIKMFDRFLKLTFDGIVDIMEGNFLTGMAKIATSIFDTLTHPIRLALKGVIALANAIPGIKGKIPKGLQEFANKGIGGIVWPKAFEVTHKSAGAVKTAQEAVKDQAAKAQKSTDATATIQKKEGMGLQDVGKMLATQLTDIKARQKAKETEKPVVNANVKLEDKRVLDINNKMCVDGESLNVASSRHRKEIQERSGFKNTPWQRGTMFDHGVVPGKGAA